MGNGDPRSKKARHAQDMARLWKNLTTLRGVPWQDEEGLYLLGGIPGPPPHAEVLAQAVYAEHLPPRQGFRAALGVGHALPVTAGLLAGWSRALKVLEGRRELEELIDEGVWPLRRYRHLDLPARIRSARRALERLALLRHCPSPWNAREAADPEADAEALVRLLPLRLYALGNWPADPVRLLLERGRPADAPLLRLARAGADRGVAVLAALLLGLRHRGAAAEKRTRTYALLPPALHAAFQAGCGGCLTPCLTALALAEELQCPHFRSLQDFGSVPSGFPCHPDLAGIAEDDRAPLVRTAARLALLHGIPAALHALDNLARPFFPSARAAVGLAGRLHRLQALAEAEARGRRPLPRSAAEQELLRGLRRVSGMGQAGARELARLFLAWVDAGAGPRVLGSRQLVRLAQAAWTGGLAAAVRGLCDAWRDAARAGGHDAATAADVQQARLALLLEHPDAGLQIPCEETADHLRDVSRALAGLPVGRVREIWPLAVRAPHPDRTRALLESALPLSLLERAERLGVLPQAKALANAPQGLARYLDCLDALRGREVPNLDVTDDWFVQLFRTGKPWVPAVALVLLGKAQPDGRTADPAALFALGRQLAAEEALAGPGQALTRALDEWSTPVLQAPPAELDRLAAALGVERARLVEYLHHRRLAGRGESFARAMLEPLREEDERAREAAFLAGRLAAAPVDEQAPLARRLQRLTDAEWLARRRRQSAARARKRLERSLAVLRQESLERALDGVYRGHLTQFLRRPLPPGPLPAGLREALHLLHAPEINPDVLRGFLDDVLHGRPLPDRPENRAWLEQAAARGIDTRAWREGLAATADIAGERIEFATERDPLRVLKMGTYFDTCLSLEGGCNAASTQVNALDVSKQVIYGRRADGTVVARKLIGATLTGELAGYHTYATGYAELVRGHLTRAAEEFARRCNLRLSNTARPETLHASFWYDDGNEPWGGGALALPDLGPPPADVPPDAVAHDEWAFARAAGAGNADVLQALALGGSAAWRDPALYRLWRDYPEAAGRLLEQAACAGNGHDVAALLTAQGRLAWTAAAPRLLEGYAANMAILVLCANLPCDPQAVRAALAEVPRIAQRQTGTEWGCLFCLERPPLHLGLAPAAELLRLLQTLIGVSDSYEADDDHRCHWVTHWAEVLDVAWLREGDPAPLVRALEDGPPLLRELAVEVARRDVVPGSARRLRKLLDEGGPRVVDVAVALGRQGEAQHAPALLALLRRRPESLPVAVAVVRCGDRQAAAEARALWRPPPTLPPSPTAGWFALLRELNSPAFTPRLVEEIRRRPRTDPAAAAPQGQAPPDLSSLCRWLAVAGPADGDVAACREAVGDDPLLRAVLDKVDRFRAELRRLPEMMSRLAGGEPESVEALAWWRAMADQAEGWGFPFRDESFERAALRLVARGTAAERAAAAGAVFRGDGRPRAERRQRWLALTGPEGPPLPAALRRQLIDDLLPPPAEQDCSGEANELDIILAWVEGLPADVQKEVFRAHPGILGGDHARQLGGLLSLESDNPGRRQAALSLLEVWAELRPAPLLAALNLALHWLPPAAIEPQVERLVAAARPEALPDEDLSGWLSPYDAGKSYRLQRALLRHLTSRLPAPRMAALVERCGWKSDDDRGRWLLAELEPLGEAAPESP